VRTNVWGGEDPSVTPTRSGLQEKEVTFMAIRIVDPADESTG